MNPFVFLGLLRLVDVISQAMNKRFLSHGHFALVAHRTNYIVLTLWHALESMMTTILQELCFLFFFADALSSFMSDGRFFVSFAASAAAFVLLPLNQVRKHKSL